MRRLDWYIGIAVLVAMAVVVLVLGGLDLLFTAIQELGETSGGYGAVAALSYVLMLFPSHLYEMLPMIALIGALAGLGTLAAGNELVAMQAAGVSRRRIAAAVMKPAVLVMGFGLLLGEVIAPPLEVRAEVAKALAQGDQVALSRYGHWERDGAAFMHFNAIEPDGILHGVSIFEYDAQQRLLRSVNAERAVYHGEGSSAGSYAWQLENGVDARYDYGNDTVSSILAQFVTQDRQLDLSPELLQVLIVNPDRMAMRDLYRYASRFERQGLDAAPYYLALWKKLLQPLATAVLVLLAISFIFGPLREATMGSRVFTAISVGLAFTILQRLVHSVSLVYQLSPLLAVLAPLLLCGLFGLVFIRRAV
jgi:lipopolysaccharide export system permease protein